MPSTLSGERATPAKKTDLLMAVVQHTKCKVWPVMDYRDPNGFVDAYTANADVCTQTLREWWQQRSNVAILDLSKAYVQVHVHREGAADHQSRQ